MLFVLLLLYLRLFEVFFLTTCLLSFLLFCVERQSVGFLSEVSLEVGQLKVRRVNGLAVNCRNELYGVHLRAVNAKLFILLRVVLRHMVLAILYQASSCSAASAGKAELVEE